jgi:hypothetical protein
MKQPKVSIQGSIVQQREMLTGLLYEPLNRLADACSRVWGDRAKMEAVLNEAFPSVPYCKLLYALNTNAIQITSNISCDGLVVEHFGRNRSDRPYMSEALLVTDFLLCEAYISLRALRPSLTAIQFVRNANGVVLGFIGADFALRDLPQTHQLYEELDHWHQFAGDPSIHGTVFNRTRSESKMDRHLDTVISVVEELMLDHGVYHVSCDFAFLQQLGRYLGDRWSVS